MKRLIIAASAISLAACGQSGAIDPGMWSTEVTLSAGQAELWSSKVERCMDPAANNEDPVTGILRTTPLGQCQAYQSAYEGGRLTVYTNCMGRPGSVIGGMPQTRVYVRGNYTASSIDGQFEAEITHEPQSSKLTGKLTARRKGDC